MWGGACKEEREEGTMKNSASGAAREREMELPLLLPMSSLSSSSKSSDVDNDVAVVQEEDREEENAPPMWSGCDGNLNLMGNTKKKRLLSKQLSMRETTREAKWEKRRRQILQRQRMMMMMTTSREEAKYAVIGRVRSLTDEDLDELRGSIELGFGFNEEDGGQDLCNTLPALDLYFAVNRQFSDPKIRYSPSPASTPTETSSSSTICGTPSPRSPNQHQQHSPAADSSWKICNPGDNPQHVKTRLRHWAQAVACSVRQCC